MEEAEIAMAIERAVARRVEEAVRAEWRRIAARLRETAGWHASFPLTAENSRDLVMGVAKAIEEGIE